MEKFSAEKFFALGQTLGVLARLDLQGDAPFIFFKGKLDLIKDYAKNLRLRQSEKCAERILRRLEHQESPPDDLQSLVMQVTELVYSEMEDQLFLWVPGHRSEWYGKTAELIVGTECCARFPSIQREVEEAAKCYAVGRYTAAAFHLTRAGEAGVQALAKAIQFKPPHNQWTLVFDRMKVEYNTPPASRPTHWKTHGKFLTNIWADLSLLARVWRNDVMHLVEIYGEEEAKELFETLPKLLRDLATHMDEQGKLY
jgi:hypothetical protein